MTRHIARLASLAACAALPLNLAACGRQAEAESTAVASTTTRTATSTVTGVKRAKWGSNVRITFGKGYMRFRSDGVPNHSRPALYALPNAGVMVPRTAADAYAGADPTTKQSYDFKIPTTPRKAAKTTAAPLGVIGVMISGATLFNPYEGDNITVATGSNFTVKASDGTSAAFLDSCNGHPTPMGQYHYHALPKCITKRIDRKSGASHILGVAFDGYPIYGDRDIGGRKVSAAKLDKCNGVTGATPEFPNGIYHYVLLDTATSNSSIRCFTGRVDSSLTRMQGMAGMGPPPRR